MLAVAGGRRPQRRGVVGTVLVGALVLVAACSGGSRTAGPELGRSDRPASSTTAPATGSTTPDGPALADPSSDAAAIKCVGDLNHRVRAGQLMMVAVTGAGLRDAAADVARYGFGGVFIMGPVGDLGADDVAALDDAAPINLLVAVDEEGGDVQRLGAVLGTLPAPGRVAETMSPDAAQTLIAEHARKARALGINVVLAPVVDVRSPGAAGPIGDRAFGDDPAVVQQFGAAYVSGWQEAGILPVLKHFPGHGAATGDTHLGPAVVPAMDLLRQRDLQPFVALVGAAPVGVMLAHVQVPGLTNGLPASLSPAAVEVLRTELGFDGLVFTDALNMNAVTASRSPAEAAGAAIAAGADVALLISVDDGAAALQALEAAIGDQVPETRVNEAMLRVLRQKGIDPCTLRNNESP